MKTRSSDICIYGGTASGIMAAIAAAKRGKSVTVVEPSRWLGGFVGGGIRVMRDCRYPDEVGGLTRMMMERDVALGSGSHETRIQSSPDIFPHTRRYGHEVFLSIFRLSPYGRS